MPEHPQLDLQLRIRAFAELRRELEVPESPRSTVAQQSDQKYFIWIRQELFRFTFISLPQEKSQRSQALSPSTVPLADLKYAEGFLGNSDKVKINNDVQSSIVAQLSTLASQVEIDMNLDTFIKTTSKELHQIIHDFHLRSDLPKLELTEPIDRKGRAWFIAPLVVNTLVEPEHLPVVKRHKQMISNLLRSAVANGVSQFIEDSSRRSSEGTPRVTWTRVVDETLRMYLQHKETHVAEGNIHVPRPAEIMTVAMWEKDQPVTVDTSSGQTQIISDDYKFLERLSDEYHMTVLDPRKDNKHSPDGLEIKN